MTRARAILIALAVLGCGHDEASGGGGGGVADESLPIPRAVLTSVCHAEPCGGDESSVEVFRDAAGSVQRLRRLYGPCSHNPAIYFDPTGRQTELIPEQPVEPGSPEQLAFQARAEAQIGGLTPAEVIRCRDAAVIRRP